MEFVPGQSEVFCSQSVPKLWPMTSKWTDKDVHDFLCDIGYGRYAQCFRNNAINGPRLLGITPFDLQRIGVKNMQDAMYLHSTIQATTNRMWYNHENHDEPPNTSYPSITRGNIVRNPKLAPGLQPEKSAAFHPGMPPLPGHPYQIDWRQLCLPYRHAGDRTYAMHHNPQQSFRGHCMVLGRTDEWKRYNSHF